MRKTISIFLASSIFDFANERMAVENFIRNISDTFEENYNIKIQPLLCENFDTAYTSGRKQEEFNQKIRESAFCFFIFFKKAGKYTREEFQVAIDQFEKTGEPKIYTYFKEIEEGTAEQSLYDFINELENTFGHHYSTFSHIDTIKLRILLSLKLKELDFLEIETTDGKCVVGGTEIMSLEHVAEFANNDQLTKLNAELAEVEAEYYKMKPDYEKGENDLDFYSKYSKLASRRQYLIDEIEELQKLIFNVSMRMIDDELHGAITERQKEAYRLFELGDYEGCMSVLNSQDIDFDFIRSRARIKEQELTVCKKYIREHKTAIDILSSMKAYAARFEKIEKRYDKIVPVILEMKTELDTALSYVSYLIDQNKDSKALPIAQELASVCDKAQDKARAFGLSGLICNHLNSHHEAEAFYLKAIELWEALAKSNPEGFNPNLATSYNNAGNFYDDQGQPDKAEAFYLKAIELREALAKANPEKFNPHLAESYNNTGIFYNYQGPSDKAEAFFLKAIELREALAKANPERFNPDLAVSYNNAGVFYKKQEQPDKAEAFYLKAIDRLESLAKENPERFNPDLAASYNNAGNLYKDQGQPDKAEAFYLKAIELREALAKENPERFNHNLATSYYNAGVFYDDQGQSNKAKAFYLKAIALWEALAKANPERFNPNLAISYYNYALFIKSEAMKRKALEVAKTCPHHHLCKFIIKRMENK